MPRVPIFTASSSLMSQRAGRSCLALPYHSQHVVVQALGHAQQLLPFPPLGLDTDNGGEFLNGEVFAFCEREQITFTRGRAYRKNDQCFVEQKNGAIVLIFSTIHEVGDETSGWERGLPQRRPRLAGASSPVLIVSITSFSVAPRSTICSRAWRKNYDRLRHFLLRPSRPVLQRLGQMGRADSKGIHTIFTEAPKPCVHHDG